MGTTRPVRPGWRAPRAAPRSSRCVVSARTPSISAARRARADQKSNVGERGERLARARPPGVPTSAESSSRMRSSSACDRELRLAPGVAQLDHDERLDEQRLAAARLVVDDALDPALGLGADGHDVAAVAQRDDRLLERAAELRAVDERLEAGPQPLVGDAHGAAQATERRRGRVEQLAGRVEAQLQPAAERAAAARCARPSSCSSGRRSLAQRVARAAPRRSSVSSDVQQLSGSSRPPRAARSMAGPMSRAPPMPTSGPLGEEVARLVGLVEPARDDDRVRARLERLGQPARRREARWPRRAARGWRELEQLDGLARPSLRCPPGTAARATGGRAGRSATGASAQSGPA